MSEGYAYMLTLELLLTFLREHKKTCEIASQVKSLVGQLILNQGEIQACSILDAGKPLLEGNEALKQMYKWGECTWFVRDVSATKATSNEAAKLKTIRVNCSNIRTLPHKHRQVLLLLQAQKDANAIYRLLSWPPEQIQAILTDLANWECITFDDK